MRVDNCLSCGAPIVWTVTVNGKKMPVDCDPKEERCGFRLEPDGRLPLGGAPLARFTSSPEPAEKLYVSHWGSCPDAAGWRGRRRL